MKYPWIDEYLMAGRRVAKDLQPEWNQIRCRIGGKQSEERIQARVSTLKNAAGGGPDAAENSREYTYLPLRDRPELLESAATWFHEKWGVPREAYRTCMAAYLNRETEYGWYLCLAGNRIVGGLGVIENDFHDRGDLAPNVCAVYTEEDSRGYGVAGRLLDLVVEDMRAKGVTPLYLVTDHTGFYERYGWEFLCMAHEEDSGNETRVYIHR